MRPPIALAPWLVWPNSRKFMVSLIECGEQGKWRPEDMLRLIACECDFRSVMNRAGYSGLTQIGKRELKSVGWRPSDGPFHLAAPDVQIRRGTLPYFEGKRREPICKIAPTGWESAEQMWHANLAPAHVGRADGVVYSQREHRSMYTHNARLDMNSDGVIDRADLAVAMAADVEANHSSMVVALQSLAMARAERENPRPGTGGAAA